MNLRNIQRREYVAIEMLKKLILSEHYVEDAAIEKSIRIAAKFIATFDIANPLTVSGLPCRSENDL